MNEGEANVAAMLTDLRRWSDALPAYDVAAGRARHVDLLERGVPGPELGVAAKLSRRAWWIGGSAIVLLGVGLAVGLAARSSSPPPPADVGEASSPARVTAAPPIVRAPAPAPSRATPAIEPPPLAASPATDTPQRAASPATDAAESVPPPSRRRPRPSARSPRSIAVPAVTNDDDALERELEVVRRLRRLVERDPGAALVLARTAEREFADGVFGEERAALRVFALAALDDPQLDAAADAFLREHGGGPFGPRVRSLRASAGR